MDYLCNQCGKRCIQSSDTDDKAGDWCGNCGTTSGAWTLDDQGEGD